MFQHYIEQVRLLTRTETAKGTLGQLRRLALKTFSKSRKISKFGGRELEIAEDV